MKIISGGQIGIDIAALRAAKNVGFETGGWMPHGFRTKYGPKPEYAEMYGMMYTASTMYPPRTLLNVMESDGTLRIAKNWNSRGEQLTLKAINQCGKPHYDLEYSYIADWHKGFIRGTQVIGWIIEHNIQILNVAGNAMQAFEEPAEMYLTALFKTLTAVDSV